MQEHYNWLAELTEWDQVLERRASQEMSERWVTVKRYRLIVAGYFAFGVLVGLGSYCMISAFMWWLLR